MIACQRAGVGLRVDGRPCKAVLCLAHVTNQMAQVVGDFDKSPDGGYGAVAETRNS
jgi:hypothetical protein